MRPTRPVTAAALAASLLLAGCLSLGGESAPRIRRHSLDLPVLGTAGTAADEGTPRAALPTVIVRQLSARARYGPQVVAVDGPGRISLLELDRWVEDPAEALTTVLRERLAASGRFHAVATGTSEMETDLVLDGMVLAFDVLRRADGPWGARVAVRLELTHRGTGNLVAARAFEAVRDLPGAGTDGVGAVMGECLADISEQALAAWDLFAERHPAIGHGGGR